MLLHLCTFLIKPIRFNKFYFRNFGHHLLKYFSSKTSSWARPLKTKHAKLKLVLDALVAFLKKRKATLTTTGKRLHEVVN